jgi:hypothetical protein
MFSFIFAPLASTVTRSMPKWLSVRNCYTIMLFFTMPPRVTQTRTIPQPAIFCTKLSSKYVTHATISTSFTHTTVQATQVLLTGKSSAISGVPSVKCRETNGEIWGLTSVSNPILAYVATAVSSLWPPGRRDTNLDNPILYCSSISCSAVRPSSLTTTLPSTSSDFTAPDSRSSTSTMPPRISNSAPVISP